jgi:serine/tyrosine/threonine adenylyltransferase
MTWPMHTLDDLYFSNSFAALPGDFHSGLRPTPLADSHLVSPSTAAAGLIDLDETALRQPEALAALSGLALPAQADPAAALDAGHHFGHWVPQLGDGRAILLGEVTNTSGQRWELQLKGAGLTPYSRDGDGRAVLRSSIRE